MGVYIDMEMPKDVTLLAISPDGTVDIISGQPDLSWKTLKHKAISVPPHGRLIDADALHKLFEDQWHYLQVLDWNENPTAEAEQSGINWCINTMHDDAPTVIPSNEGG